METYPRVGCDDLIWEKVEIEATLLVNVLEKFHYLKSKHVLSTIVTNLCKKIYVVVSVLNVNVIKGLRPCRTGEYFLLTSLERGLFLYKP